jgi:hypothetical protein
VSAQDLASVQGRLLASIHCPTPSMGHAAIRHYVL